MFFKYEMEKCLTMTDAFRKIKIKRMKISVSLWVFNKLMKHHLLFSDTTLIKFKYNLLLST